MGQIVWWNFSAKCWAELGLGSIMAAVHAVLSVKKAM